MNNLKVIFDLNTSKTVFINPDEIISIMPVMISGTIEKPGSLINMRFGKTYRVIEDPKDIVEFLMGTNGSASLT